MYAVSTSLITMTIGKQTFCEMKIFADIWSIDGLRFFETVLSNLSTY
jgi:hypothetical protein